MQGKGDTLCRGASHRGACRLRRGNDCRANETRYSAIEGTQLETLGYAVTDCGGDVESALSRERPPADEERERRP